MNDPDGLYEEATFCKLNDDKRPGVVGTPDFSTLQICPDDLTMGAAEATDVVPDAWFARIMFDELLDPAVEDLIPNLGDDGRPDGTFTGSLATTQPVILTCGGPDGTDTVVPYDGYYTPNGNNVTYPLGPSLLIQPIDATSVPTGTRCSITLKDTILDKDGIAVPEIQRGPFTFVIAELAIVDSSPAPDTDDEVAPSDAGFTLTFNAPANAATFSEGDDFTVSPTVPDLAVEQVATTTIGISGTFAPDTTYTLTILPGATVSDGFGAERVYGAADAGAADDGFRTLTFQTAAFAFLAFEPADGAQSAASAGAGLLFNSSVDANTLGTDEISISPAVANLQIGDAGPTIVLTGEFLSDTDYTVTFVAGATVDDSLGNTFTNTAAQTSTFHTAPFAITRITPADGTTTGPGDGIVIEFTQLIDPLSVLAADFVLAPSIAIAQIETGDNSVVITGDFLPDTDYTLTIPMGAVVQSPGGETYTQASTQVVAFHVDPIALTSTSPEDRGFITAGDGVTFTFNTELTGLSTADFTVDPAVTGLTVTRQGLAVVLDGDFVSDTNYQVTFHAGAAATATATGTPYAQPHDVTIRFRVNAS